MDAAMVVEAAVFKVFCTIDSTCGLSEKYLKEINKITFTKKITFLQTLQDILHADVFTECENFFLLKI
jgi:hypothetical protein